MAKNIHFGAIIKISGPLVVAADVPRVKLFDVVLVGTEKLMGEVIELRNNLAWIQVYEETTGISIGEPVVSTHKPLSVTLGPGLMSRFYDGIQRPLEAIAAQSGVYIGRGINVPAVDEEKKWDFIATANSGDRVEPGDILGTVQETDLIVHKIMVPAGVYGTVEKIGSVSATVRDTVATIKTKKGIESVSLVQDWPIRVPRTMAKRLTPTTPLLTGQRIVDTFFPILKGGTAATPGPFGSGKTVIQQQLAKWSDAQVIIYVGCGERGNEMTDVLKEFPELIDPHSGKPLMERTILIANTSNMPIAAREASIYTGITLAEYYRDMGYDVALMADSTSRWAEALREMSGRLEEMPGEEGYPAYLASRIAAFYERAGVVQCKGQDKRTGSITVVGAVSPPGGDLSEPVSQSSLRVVKVFWALDGALAYARHYPAINWLNSYSLYAHEADAHMAQSEPEFARLRVQAIDILRQEAKLEEIIRIVGMSSLSRAERLLLHTAKSLREDYLQQNAYDDIDTYSSIPKQVKMLKAILTHYETSLELLENNVEVDIEDITKTALAVTIGQLKMIPEEKLSTIDTLIADIPAIVRKDASIVRDEADSSVNLHEAITHVEK
jgi:V/A-type H+/Na+-transporting ATPase subunit A